MGCGASSASPPASADKPVTSSFNSVETQEVPGASLAVAARPQVVVPDITSLSDLQVMRILGAGSFGAVNLVKHPSVEDTAFALKRMSKVHILGQKNGANHINNERKLLALCDSPFVNTMYAAFQDATDVYLLLELVLGGDLLDYMEKNPKCPVDTAKFYVASAVCAIEYLHGLDIVYRDTKPENLMIDSAGYLKVVDFGFAKKVAAGEKTYTLCGSPEYMAPETILGKGHDRRCDWWSVGILLIELLTSETPFSSDDKGMTYKRIVKGDVDWKELGLKGPPQKFAEQALGDPSERLGSVEKGGPPAVKKAPFFKGFDFGALGRRELTAPFVPLLESQTDTSNCRGEADINPPETDEEGAAQYTGQELHSHFPEFKRLDA